MCGGTVTDATAGTLFCLGKKRTWRRNRNGAMLSFCVTAGHPGCLRLILVSHIVHHPAAPATQPPVECNWDTTWSWMDLPAQRKFRVHGWMAALFLRWPHTTRSVWLLRRGQRRHRHPATRPTGLRKNASGRKADLTPDCMCYTLRHTPNMEIPYHTPPERGNGQPYTVTEYSGGPSTSAHQPRNHPHHHRLKRHILQR
jgi:hypothetical protein